MTRFFLVVAALVALPACSDRFNPTPLPDLYKDPYDFAVVVPPFTGPGSDMAEGGGSGGGGGTMQPHDLAVPHDLTQAATD